MPSPYDQIPDEVLKQAAEDASRNTQKDNKGKSDDWKPNPQLKETRQRRIFKRRRAGVVLSRELVKEIKAGRKKLRREMKARGIKSKREFELVAGSLGLYFDKRKGFLFWLLGHWLGTLITAMLLMFIVLFIFSLIPKLRGYFTISLDGQMLREGFVLSEAKDFEITASELFAEPAERVPCISLGSIPADVDSIDGQHNADYFAYTYYIRNEGETTVDYEWDLNLLSESLDLSTAAWILVFEDGEMRMYAEANSTTGEEEALPAKDDDRRGYIKPPVMDLAPDSDQFELINVKNGVSYYRVIPDKFESDKIITTGEQFGVAPMEVHKYTVVIWLEGDDVDADNSKIGGHLGLMMGFRLKRGE